MDDEFIETESYSWPERIAVAFQGVAVGAILIPLSILLLNWNEKRAVQEEHGLKEGAAEVISVSPSAILPANENKLIHFTGEVPSGMTIFDPSLNLAIPGLRADRHVEVYQWKESSSTDSQKHFGGSVSFETRYSYGKGWSDVMIDSATFKQPRDHVNPAFFPVERATLFAQNVAMGAFRIPANFIASIEGDVALPATSEFLLRLPPALKARARLDGEAIYLGSDPKNPEVGDARITYKVLHSGTFSILGRQTGHTLAPFATHEGTFIQRMEPGTLGAEIMFRHAERDNHITTWILRVVGWLVMALGVGLLMAPMKVFADFVPFLGTLVGSGILVVALVVAAGGSLVVIAIAWLGARPQLAFILIGSAVTLLLLGFVRVIIGKENA